MEEQIKQSWWKRNWKWALPTGGCLGIIVVFVLFVGGIVAGVGSILSGSQPQVDAIKLAQENTELVEILGEPIETNGMTGGSFNNSGGFKTAEITIPIKGPNGEASIHVEGEGVDDTWRYQVMDVYVDGSNTVINLLEESTELKD